MYKRETGHWMRSVTTTHTHQWLAPAARRKLLCGEREAKVRWSAHGLAHTSCSSVVGTKLRTVPCRLIQLGPASILSQDSSMLPITAAAAAGAELSLSVH